MMQTFALFYNGHTSLIESGHIQAQHGTNSLTPGTCCPPSSMCNNWKRSPPL
jgi:hypothetical protein